MKSSTRVRTISLEEAPRAKHTECNKSKVSSHYLQLEATTNHGGNCEMAEIGLSNGSFCCSETGPVTRLNGSRPQSNSFSTTTSTDKDLFWRRNSSHDFEPIFRDVKSMRRHSSLMVAAILALFVFSGTTFALTLLNTLKGPCSCSQGKPRDGNVSSEHKVDITKRLRDLQSALDTISQKYKELNSSLVAGVRGPRGLQGVPGVCIADVCQGSPGPQGQPGPPGENGQRGPIGPAGIKGPVGPSGVNGSIGQPGPQGLQGLQGIQGTRGVDGAQGPQGPRGLMGANNSMGAPGPPGPRGPQGTGNLSLCEYHEEKDARQAAGNTAQGKAILRGDKYPGYVITGATCTTRYGKEAQFDAVFNRGAWVYSCYCRGSSVLFNPGNRESVTCSIHYWICPIIT